MVGLGFVSDASRSSLFKEGHDDGCRNHTACVDEKKMGIVILTNSSNGEGGLQRIAGDLSEEYIYAGRVETIHTLQRGAKIERNVRKKELGRGSPRPQ
jgi:hypothetical protein